MLSVSICRTLGLAFFILLSVSCSQDTDIGNNMFIHGNSVYKVSDNEIVLVGGLSDVRKLEVLKPELRSYGRVSLGYVKRGAYADLDALYRGNYLYFSLDIEGLNDLRDKYRGGGITVNFRDEYGFLLHEFAITSSDLIAVVGEEAKTITKFTYSGKTEMSTDIHKAIVSYDISSSFHKRSYYE